VKSLFEQLVDEIDAAIVDVTLSKIPKGEKAKKLRRLILARDYQLQVAGIMDQIYPESVLCAASNSPAECKSMGCVNVVHCEGKALKRLMIEGRIIRAIDELPEEESPLPCSGDCRNCNSADPYDKSKKMGYWTMEKKIDPRKTWMI